MILALQLSPYDVFIGKELMKLICDIEPTKRDDVEICISARRDTNKFAIADIVEVAKTKFKVVHKLFGKRRSDGWPIACNDLWAETMMNLSMMKDSGGTQAEAVLTFEADCVPLRPDWINQLKSAWHTAKCRGLRVAGHMHRHVKDGPITHINGNAIFEIGLMKDFPEMNGSDPLKGWDVEHAKVLLSIGMDTPFIHQLYRIKDIDLKTLTEIRKKNRIPALFHGIKNGVGIPLVRQIMGTPEWESRLATCGVAQRVEYDLDPWMDEVKRLVDSLDQIGDSADRRKAIRDHLKAIEL